MPLFATNRSRVWVLSLLFFVSILSVVAVAQTNLPYRLLKGFTIRNESDANKGKATLFMLEEAAFEQLFTPTGTGKRTDAPNFGKEMVVSVVIPATNKPPKLSISKVFVQDSTLTVRYIRMADTTLTQHPLPEKVHPFLLVAIPKTAVLKAKLVENGKVVQTLNLREAE